MAGFVADPGTQQSEGMLPTITARLNSLGKYLGVTIYGISGYRTPAHSVAVGGSANDPHTQGLAEDIGVNSQLRTSAATISEATLRKFGLYRPFDPTGDPSNPEVNHIQLLSSATSAPSTVSSGTQESLASLWVQAGGPPSVANIMAAIAMAESGGNASIVQKGQPYATTGWGLWQITPGNSVPSIGTDNQLLDPLTNARAAVAKYRSQGLGAWTTYTSGAYKSFLGGNDVVSGGSASMFTRPGGQPSQQPQGDGGTAEFASYENELQGGWSSGSSEFVGFSPFGPSLIPGIPFNPLSVFQDAGSAVSDVGTFLKWIAWIFHPRNILRAVEFLTGIVLVLFSFQALAQAVGERREGYATGESALSRSGLGRVARELGTAVAPEAGAARKITRRVAPAPHRTRRTALRVRYERERHVARRQTSERRG